MYDHYSDCSYPNDNMNAAKCTTKIIARQSQSNEINPLNIIIDDDFCYFKRDLEEEAHRVGKRACTLFLQPWYPETLELNVKCVASYLSCAHVRSVAT